MITGLPKTIKLTSEEVRVALKEATGQIVDTVHGVLEKTPRAGCGYCGQRNRPCRRRSHAPGMDTLIEQRTGVSTLTVQDAMNVVVVGTGKYPEIRARMEEDES